MGWSPAYSESDSHTRSMLPDPAYSRSPPETQDQTSNSSWAKQVLSSLQRSKKSMTNRQKQNSHYKLKRNICINCCKECKEANQSYPFLLCLGCQQLAVHMCGEKEKQYSSVFSWPHFEENIAVTETHTILHNLQGLFTFQPVGTWSMFSVGLLIKILAD